MADERLYPLAYEVANTIGTAIDKLPDGEYRTSPYNGVRLADDNLYEKCRLIDRITDALADYFNEEWTDDAAMLVALPYERECQHKRVEWGNHGGRKACLDCGAVNSVCGDGWKGGEDD